MKISARKQTAIAVVLCNIRSVVNVGAIVRTADAIGASRVICAGYTPGPMDRFGRVRKDFAKASLGAEHRVTCEAISSSREALKLLRKEGYYLIAVEQDDTAIDYKHIDVSKKEKVAVVFGNEREGLPKDVLIECDAVAEIPMRGSKESLNVSVSAGITLFRFFDRA